MVKPLMRLLNLKAPVLALVLAIAALVLSVVLSYCIRIPEQIFMFYYPAIILSGLCAPSSFPDTNCGAYLYDHHCGATFFWFFLWLFSFLQWYSIFLIFIHFFRRYKHKIW